MDRWKLARLTACLAVIVALIMLGVVAMFREPTRPLLPDPFGGRSLPGFFEPRRSLDPFVVLRPQMVRPEPDFDALIDLITSTIAPTTWEDVGGPGSLEDFDPPLKLVIFGGQEIVEHDEESAEPEIFDSANRYEPDSQ